MACYWCSVKEGTLTLLEHEAAAWLPLDDLRQVNWLPADILVIDEIEMSEQENQIRRDQSEMSALKGRGGWRVETPLGKV
jgi:hypothetical protein